MGTIPDVRNNPDIVCHHLAIDVDFKPVTKRKHKEGVYKRPAISKEVEKLKEGVLYEKSYTQPSWIT